MALNSYMMPYHPYRGGANRDHDRNSQTLVYLKANRLFEEQRKEEFQRMIVHWLRYGVGLEQAMDIVIAIAPGHEENSDGGQNLLYDCFNGFLGHGRRVADGRRILRRTATVPKAATGGPRDQALHEQTIEVRNPATVRNKIVYIFDDVWTTGATLLACAEVVKSAGAIEVNLYAVGKTE